MKTMTAEHFDRHYQTHLKHLKLKGLQPKTIDAYARAIRRIGAYRNARTGKMERRTVSGAQFLWLVLQHVLPKSFRRARNFGFLHPNCKRLIALLQVLLKFVPGQAAAWVRERSPILCACCGAVMVIVRTRIRTLFAGPAPVPRIAGGAL